MKQFDVQFTLSYSGGTSEDHKIDLYDVSQALIGFQRSLALTTHLVLNGKIITQSPSLKGAEIYALPAAEGSWKINAGILILGTAAYQLGTTPGNTPLGHLIFSTYDYVISESLGYHVDYNKSLGQLNEEYKKKNIILPTIRRGQLDSLVEKCSIAITEMHRPIYKTKTATTGRISSKINNIPVPIKPIISFDTFQYIIEEYEADITEVVKGCVSGYNSNTFKGRIFVSEEERTIPFELSEKSKDEQSIQLIVDSLRSNALRNYEYRSSDIFCMVKKITSKSGALKRYTIISVSGTFISN